MTDKNKSEWVSFEDINKTIDQNEGISSTKIFLNLKTFRPPTTQRHPIRRH